MKPLRRSPLLLSLPLLLSTLVAYTYGFPDHLQGPIGCATELATDEVIMNSYVTAYEKSRDQDIVMAIKTKSGEILTDSPISITEVPVSFDFVVLNPNNMDNVQYVMDTTPGAKFDFGTCEGNVRVTGRVGNKHTLLIETIPENPIEVWAGWSTSHETVTLTNKFVLQKDAPAEPAVEEIVEEVKELEEAEEHEREEVQKDLGDDDEANVGDLEQQLDKMHADPALVKKMEKVFENHAQWKEKDAARGLHLDNLDKYKEMLKDKPKLAHGNLDMDWKKVKERLNQDAKFKSKEQRVDMMNEHKRLMKERREKMMNDHPEGLSNGLKDLRNRDNKWKERLQERKREMLKAKAPDPADAEEEEVPKRRARELYEEQESDIVLKEFLMGLLGVMIANWLVLQICLWNDKKKKGRRSN